MIATTMTTTIVMMTKVKGDGRQQRQRLWCQRRGDDDNGDVMMEMARATMVTKQRR